MDFGPDPFEIEIINEIKHAARVLSRYRDARRTRILRIRLRPTLFYSIIRCVLRLLQIPGTDKNITQSRHKDCQAIYPDSLC